MPHIGKDSTLQPDTSGLWLLFWQTVCVYFLSFISFKPFFLSVGVSCSCFSLLYIQSVSYLQLTPMTWLSSLAGVMCKQVTVTSFRGHTACGVYQFSGNEATFPGVNTPTRADFKLPKGRHCTWSWKEIHMVI